VPGLERLNALIDSEQFRARWPQLWRHSLFRFYGFRIISKRRGKLAEALNYDGQLLAAGKTMED